MRTIEQHGTQAQKDLLRLGQEYERFVASKTGIRTWQDAADQYSKGEGPDRVEIKLDRNFRKTGNLYIEVAEKQNAANRHYAASGILREDDTLRWLIGDRQTAWLFDKEALVELIDDLRLVTTPTSKGILLPIAKANELCLRRWEW